eukprot:8846610-Pyramimonas_sp.AAC.1
MFSRCATFSPLFLPRSHSEEWLSTLFNRGKLSAPQVFEGIHAAQRDRPGARSALAPVSAANGKLSRNAHRT